jgi:rod shape-determining protein MreD
VKRTSLILLIGIAAPVLQGALNTFVPARFAPDLGLLVVIALGLHWRSTAGGLALAATLGFAADLLSGSLLGQQALLRLLAFGAARFASGHLNLRGAVPQSLFVLGLTAMNAHGIATQNVFFTAGGGFDLVMLRDLLSHALVNALFASPVSRLVETVANSFGDDEGSRRGLRLTTRVRST